MALESILFLLAVAAVSLAMLLTTARMGPRDASRILLYLSALAFPLGGWFVRVLFQDTTVLAGLFVLAVAFGVAYYAIDRNARRREGLVFYDHGICAFRERAVSGRSCDTTLMRLGGAKRTLVVTVTEDEVWIRPVAPLTMFARVWGLIHRIPLRKIHQMERLASGRSNVRFEYEAADGWCRCVELRLKNPGAFIEAVRTGQLEAVS